MHLWHCFPLPLMALVSFAFAAQTPLFPSNATISSTNLVDALSADPDYSSLLLLLQRAKLIPTLNKLKASTLFAPTNDAIERYKSHNNLWSAGLMDDCSLLRDNVQEALRQELFYHLLNYTLSELPKDQNPEVLSTLHYPRRPTTGPPSRDPPPYPPWLPVPGGTLGGRPQRLRIASRDDNSFAGVDFAGNGGSQLVKYPVNTSNGMLLGLGEVLEVPPDLATIIQRHPQLTYLAKILNPDIIHYLNNTSELTLFLPVDSAWDALPHYERLYLESELASDDLTRIVNMHAVHKKTVKYSDSLSSGLNLTTVDGPKLEIVVTPENKTMISTAELVEPDVYASNGVLHTISSLLIPEGALQPTPEKYLLVYKSSHFVTLLHSVNLTSLINDTETPWTILAPRDDVISFFTDGNMPEKGSVDLKKMLQYHFIPGKQPLNKLRDGMLLETALEEPGLAGRRQVLSVEVTESRQKGENKTVRFGGASIIESVEIVNTLFYFISKPLNPPEDVLTTALPSLDLSSFLAAIFSTKLDDKLKYAPQTTLLIPHNAAFKRLGLLVSSHLLAATSKSDLEKVILHHALDSVVYAQDLRSGSQRTFGTLEGSDVHLDKNGAENGTMLLTASGGWADMHSRLHPTDTLTKTGVIHEVSDLMLPRSVELTVGKLVRAAKGSTMASMVVKAGLDWVLNGTAPPDGSPWADAGLGEAGWTLLCPSDDAFKNVKLTELYADEELLRSIVTQHLIPHQSPKESIPEKIVFDNTINNRPLIFDDDTTYSTLLSSSNLYGDIVFRVEGDGNTVVGIKGARGNNGKRDWAHVVAWGRSTTGGGRGGVIQIDRLLVPYSPSWWNAYGAPLGVGLIGVCFIGLFFYAVRLVWLRDTTEATYEPVGGFGQDDE